MAVLQMQRILICGLKKERKQVLELLQRKGVVEITHILEEDQVFKKMDVSAAKSALGKNITIANDALAVLEKYSPQNKSLFAALNGRNEVSSQVYDEFREKYEITLNTARKINVLAKEIAEHQGEIIKLKNTIETLLPWANLDISLNFSGTKSTKAFIGVLPNLWSLDMIYESMAEHMPLDVEIISESREQTCIFVICGKEKSDAAAETLRGLGFAYPNSVSGVVPREQIRELEKEISAASVAIRLKEEEIASYETIREDLCFLSDYETMRADKYEVLDQLYQSPKAFIITGYIPKREEKALEDALKRFTVSVEFEEPDEEEDVPVLLHNNGLVSPLETTVEAFSPPAKGEIDPTTVVSLFYYILFGLMLSDAGYGAIIAIACGVGLLKFKNTLEESTKRTLKMYFFCGLGTVFWGVMFGSYFGDIVDVVSAKFFGQKIVIPPLWFFPVEDPMRLLTFSMGFGVVHIMLALFLKGYQLWKQKDYKGILYDVVSWYVLVLSCIGTLLSAEMFAAILGLSSPLPAIVGKISMVLAVIASIMIIATNGRESKNPFKRFLKGLYALYGISGYLSDILSYSRLLALGLATGIICTVINKMASMLPGGIIGAIAFIIVVVFGHALNIGINALGAYVHTNRLQYVEFFGKFYEGGGRKFMPFTTNTKYFKFKEKN